MNYLGSNPVKIIGERTSNNLINQNLLIGKTGVSRAVFEGYDCIKMTGYAITTIPFYSKAGQTIRLSADFAYENGIDMYWAYLYADGTKSNSLYSLSISSGNSSFERKTTTARTPSKDIVGIEIQRYGSSNRIVYVKDIMLNYGDTALPYEPYNQLWRVRSGAMIRNPKNLIPFPYGLRSGTTRNGVTLTYDDYGVIRLSGQSNISGYTNMNLTNTVRNRFSLKAGKYRFSHGFALNNYFFLCVVYTKGGTWVKNINLESQSSISFSISQEYEDNEYKYELILVIRGNANVDGLVISPILNEGDTAEPFYVRD